MPYICCIFVFLNTVIVVACVIFIPGFSPCRGYWVWVFCCLFVCIYMLGWSCRATCYFVSTFQCLVYHLLSKWKEALEFTYRVIVEVLVLGLLVVVYEIPYSSCMWTRYDVISVFPSYYCLSGTTCVRVIVQYVTTSLLLCIIAVCVIICVIIYFYKYITELVSFSMNIVSADAGLSGSRIID